MGVSFEEFRSVYPKRKGSNPWVPAERSFEKAIKRVNPQTIIDAAKVYAAEQASCGHIGTPYVCQAVTWLNQQRWKDYERKDLPTKALTWVSMNDLHWPAMVARYRAEHNKQPPHVAGLNGNGWRFPTEWMKDYFNGRNTVADLSNPGAYAGGPCDHSAGGAENVRMLPVRGANLRPEARRGADQVGTLPRSQNGEELQQILDLNENGAGAFAQTTSPAEHSSVSEDLLNTLAKCPQEVPFDG